MDKQLVLDQSGKYGVQATKGPAYDKYMYFKANYRAVNESIKSFPYRLEFANLNIHMSSLHWGQLKLFVSEIQAYTKFYNELSIHPELIVYAGGASGHHWCYLWPILKQVNPQLQVFLIDPGNFHKSIVNNNMINKDMVKQVKDPGIYILQEYYTDETSKVFSELNKHILFLSDIRSSYDLDDKQKGQMDIFNNNIMQERWVKLLKPDCAYLKLHIPYPSAPDRWIKEFPYRARSAGNVLELKLLKPVDIYFQAFHGRASSELRSIYFSKYGFNDDYWYDTKLIEQKLFAYNIYRQASCFVEHTHKNISDYLVPNLDSELTELIFARFFEQFKVEPKISEFCQHTQINFDILYQIQHDNWLNRLKYKSR
jgi:hypothetical protein